MLAEKRFACSIENSQDIAIRHERYSQNLRFMIHLGSLILDSMIQFPAGRVKADSYEPENRTID